MPTSRARPSRPRAIGEIVSGPDDRVGDGFAALVAAVEAAFRREELIMETLGYVHLHEHREENAVVLSALHHVLPDVERGDHMLGRQVLSALAGVLDLHRLSGELALTVAAQPSEVRARGRAARATWHVATRRSTPR
jgi:hemerythrin